MVIESIESWLKTKQLEGRSKRTLKYYRDTAERLAKFLDRDPADATTDEVRSFLASFTSTCTNVTINNYRRNLNSYYNYLEDEDKITKSPMRRIHYIKEDKTVKEPFADEEVQRILDAASDMRDKAIIAFLASTACRVGEVVDIKTADVNMNEREAKVYGKGGKERIVYFDARAKIALREYMDTRDDACPYLFVCKQNDKRPLTVGAVETIVRNVGKKAGVEKCHPHRFRRTVATRAIDRGMPIEQTKELLGHSQIQTTMIYAKVSRENVKASHRRYLS